VATDIMNRRIEDIGGVQEPDIQISGDDTVVVQLPGVEDEQRAIEAVGQTGLLSFRPVLDAVTGEIGPLAGTGTPNIDDVTGLTIEDDINSEAWLQYLGSSPPQVLRLGPVQVAGEDVADAVPLFDPNGADWSVSLDLTGEGGVLFAEMTADAARYALGDPRRQIAIVLDGGVITAPGVNPSVSPETGITGGRALITTGQGEEAQQEANDLAVVLRYGSLPVAFEVSAVSKVSGTLGADSLQAGILAGLLGLALVAVVLLLVYRSLGLVAILGLTVFGSVLVWIFGLLGDWIGLTLTLAGVTGIIVSVGITADSYIVYYERIKEKLRDGHEVQEAASEGFKAAFRTILTADTVSLIGATLLYMLAVGAVKGFALALGIATVLDILIVRFYTRPAVGLLAGTRLGSGSRFSIEGAAR
jgi:preprotein translocase subunit SecD